MCCSFRLLNHPTESCLLSIFWVSEYFMSTPNVYFLDWAFAHLLTRRRPFSTGWRRSDELWPISHSSPHDETVKRQRCVERWGSVESFSFQLKGQVMTIAKRKVCWYPRVRRLICRSFADIVEGHGGQLPSLLRRLPTVDDDDDRGPECLGRREPGVRRTTKCSLQGRRMRSQSDESHWRCIQE